MQQVPADQPDPRKVLVIHGRNDTARAALFAFLRSLSLQPIEWSQAVAQTQKGSPYNGEVLDALFGMAQGVVVFQTPDDISYLHPSLTHEGDIDADPQPQPRPNVLFEAGMAMGRAPERTIFVEFGRIRAMSDVHGRNVVRLDGSIAKRQDLAGRLRTAGCAVDTDGYDWHGAGDLTPPAASDYPLGRRLPSKRTGSTPHLDTRFYDGGNSNAGRVDVINLGPGDIFDLEVSVEESRRQLTRLTSDAPVPKLPAGKSVPVLRMFRVDTGDPPYFTINVKGRTSDGEPIDEDLFVSTGG